MDRFENLGVIKTEPEFDEKDLNHFTQTINALKNEREWTKEEIVKLFFQMLPDFDHKETGKYLDNRM